MKKISLIFGTRPEAIKLCPLVKRLLADGTFQVEVCVTGQHREMLDQVLRIFNVIPDIDLRLMQPNQNLAALTGRILIGIDEYLKQSKPDIIIVQGDTTTVMAAAMAAFYNRMKIAHVEAGLRTGELYSPWPEEGNRIITGHLADFHFCPTETSRNNLLREGISSDCIFVTGNTVIDALYETVQSLKEKTIRIAGIPDEIQPGCNTAKMVLITGHRRENFGGGFLNICHAIADLATTFPEVHFVYPMHMNPQVRKPIAEILQDIPHDNVHLIEPLPYENFIALMERATLILTDSGGVQEEAPSLGKPVIVMRDTTERPEAVSAGTVKLVGADREKIVEECTRLLKDPLYYQAMAQAKNPYGDGLACDRIVRILKEKLK